ncbi:hypothetical protein LM602_06645 [Candidatus Acetothermia bacterium]|jgi:hypothetical protein|nr:hypothetical protein [Candidatus Acetothermia bacterium]MCI2432212.1 hypothetical protein [Candidatus Acetothermia bacterium]MCI2436115.1 hypothetical protein [Candidatus Acetothermia bacterium]
MPKRKKTKALAVVEPTHDLTEVELSDADRAILAEVNLNRKAIVKLGQIALDHERRIGSLEEAIGELAGEEPEPIDVKAEKVKDEED